MSHYRYHVFFCCNQRAAGASCCNDHQAERLRAYAKRRIQELGVHGSGQVRINSAGCLDRCSLGPALVIYPEGAWYTYTDEADVEEIIAEHLLGGRVVQRLKLDAEPG